MVDWRCRHGVMIYLVVHFVLSRDGRAAASVNIGAFGVSAVAACALWWRFRIPNAYSRRRQELPPREPTDLPWNIVGGLATTTKRLVRDFGAACWDRYGRQLNSVTNAEIETWSPRHGAFGPWLEVFGAVFTSSVDERITTRTARGSSGWWKLA